MYGSILVRPLTLVMKVKPNVLAASVTPGMQTVGLRMPNHPVALRLLQTLKKPLAAPSANRSGKPSPTKAMHVWEDLQGLIPCILDGGMTGIGVESTVLDVTLAQPVILRPGGVTKEMLEQVIEYSIRAKLRTAKNRIHTKSIRHEIYALCSQRTCLFNSAGQTAN